MQRAASENRAVCWNLLLLTWGGAVLAAVMCFPRSAPSSVPGPGPAPDAEPEAKSPAPVVQSNLAEPSGWNRSVAGSVCGLSEFTAPIIAGHLGLPVNLDCAACSDARTPPQEASSSVAATPPERPAQRERTSSSTSIDNVEAPREESSVRSGHAHQEGAEGAWFRTHQNAEGYWCPATFGLDSTRASALHEGNRLLGGIKLPDTGTTDARIEATALTVLAFTGAGYDHKEGEYKKLMRQALLWLLKQQQEDGRLGVGSGDHMRAHAFATMALSETYGLSGDASLKPHVEKAVQYLLRGRSPRGGWAEHFGGTSPDCISTTIAVLGLKHALVANVEVDVKDAFAAAGEFMDQLVEGVEGQRLVKYSETQLYPTGPNGYLLNHRLPICEAGYLLAGLLMGRSNPKPSTIKEFAGLLVRPENLPRWDAGQVDMLYWWFATLGSFGVGEETWKTFEAAIRKTLLGNQRGYSEEEKEAGVNRQNTDEFGSWDAVDAWSIRVGRVGSSALAALTLQVTYRYLRESVRVVPEAKDRHGDDPAAK